MQVAGVRGIVPTGVDAERTPPGVIRSTRRTLVWRTRLAGSERDVICKKALGPGAAARLRNERRILARLAGVDGIPKVVPCAQLADAIVFQDTGAVPLSCVLADAPLELASVVDLALQLSRIVAAMHARGVLHKDINPQNILYSAADKRALLIDFDLASTYALERPEFTPHRNIAGTLAYLAPEQTGRTGRPVDQRSDLYALGATLYELIAGHPPFEESDDLQLINDQLVRVPRSPVEIDPSLPAPLSAIVMRLLEKEPDQRYQGAEGLGYDLERARDALARGSREAFELGKRDFPSVLLAPSRLVGRDAERESLRAAFDTSLHSAKRAAFVSGAPGTGKSVLVDELRTIAAQKNGWFVKGKFDRLLPGGSGMEQALRAVGRLLLAEPEESLAEQRRRLATFLGSNAGRVAGLIPEFEIILGVSAERTSSDPIEAQLALRRAIFDVFRAVASPARPLVVFFDDVQWAGAGVFGLIDAIVSDAGLRGLLFVGTYRSTEVDERHPLFAALERWERLAEAPLRLQLQNLQPHDIRVLLADMLRLSPARSARLGEAVGLQTAGNPFDTIVLINALRRDAILVPATGGWMWDDAAIRRYVGSGSVLDLLAARIARMPVGARQVISVIACLGSGVRLSVLERASACNEATLFERLEAPLEDGLLEMERGDTVRFAHDRVQQAAYERLGPSERRDLHLLIARRLAPVPDLAWKAAEQYVLVVDSVARPSEARDVVAIFAAAAASARLATSYAAVETFLAAALALLEAIAQPSDVGLRRRLQVERHAALYGLGRYEEADALYGVLESEAGDIVVLATAACVQVCSLSNRAKYAPAVELGLALLSQLGKRTPGANIRAEVILLLDALEVWIAADMPTPAAASVEHDARQLVAARLAARVETAAFFSDPTIMSWLVLERHRYWLERGCPAALGLGFAVSAIALIALRSDFRGAYRIARWAFETNRNASELDEWQNRHVFDLVASHWEEALDGTFERVQRTREGLLQGGDLRFACLSYTESVAAQFECAPSLESPRAEAESAVDFASRIGNEHARTFYTSYLFLIRRLQGEAVDAATLPGVALDGGQSCDLKASSAGTAISHINFALAAAIFGESEALAEHAAAAMPLVPFVSGMYCMAQAYVLRACALANELRTGSGADAHLQQARGELAVCERWLTLRAADAPDNFLHLARFVEAERAWASGDLWQAAAAFNAARHEVERRVRPWHRALITERAALFFIETCLDLSAGHALLRDARNAYANWGASVKAAHLEDCYPFLREPSPYAARDGVHTLTASSDAIDLLGILRVSQALSSETSVTHLRARIVESLEAITGATAVHVASFDDEKQGWFVPAAGDENALLPVESAAARGAFPLSPFRYVERTREPLLVEDTTKDERFASDRYLTRLPRCSLLVVPILSKGVLRAVLLLENRLATGAFTTDRLASVSLLAGQLAVSLDNASLYASLERKVAERTAALEVANRQLEVLSVTDALTGLANRRRLSDFIDAEWTRALRMRTSIAIAIADIDNFKLYNDRYGHIAGDACLRLVAREIQRQARQSIDLVARYGGEEFAIVLPGLGGGEARSAVTRICATIAALAEPHAAVERGIVTVSIGAAAVVPVEADGSQHLLGAADAALYRAKAGGRNCIRVAGDEAERLAL